MDIQGQTLEGIDFGGFSVRDVHGLMNWLLPGEGETLGAQQMLLTIRDQVTGDVLSNGGGFAPGMLKSGFLAGVPVIRFTYGSSPGLVAPHTQYMSWVLASEAWTMYMPVHYISPGAVPRLIVSGNSSQTGTAPEMTFFFGSDPNYRFYLRNVVSIRSGSNIPPLNVTVILKIMFRRSGGVNTLSIFWVTKTGNILQTTSTSTNALHEEGTAFTTPLKFMSNVRAHLGEVIVKNDSGIAADVLAKDEQQLEKYLQGKYLA